MIQSLDPQFSSLNHYIKEKHPSKVFILVDENTQTACLPNLLKFLDHAPSEILSIPSGEGSKSMSHITKLWENLMDGDADRKSLLINLGGGVVTDIGGFLASTYKRGIPFVHIPTSLLGMVDASIGGKTGINHQYLKNIIGTFAMPEKIFIYPSFLDTLPHREIRSGFAEMLKHGLIADRKHWEALVAMPELSSESLAPHIQRSMEIKQHVVVQDFREQGLRKILNFGHTIGHAIESLCLHSGGEISHGEAVAIGMICEAHLSYLEGFISKDTSEELVSLIKKHFPPIDIQAFSNEHVFALMSHDKKNTHGSINFSLLNSIGCGNFDKNVPKEYVFKALDYYK